CLSVADFLPTNRQAKAYRTAEQLLLSFCGSKTTIRSRHMNVDEIAPDVFRLSLYMPEMNIQFNQFLVRDDEPLLFHTGMRAIFPQVREAVSRVIDPTKLRWISFSHFEADECGALNEWLDTAPQATAVCSFVGANVSVNDFANRPARAMNNDEM